MRKTYTPDRLTRADKLAQKIIAKVEELFVKKDGKKVLSTNDYTTAEKKKLAGLSEGATKTAKSTTNGNILIDNEETTVYTHPESAAGAKTAGLYKIATDKEGHVTAATAVAKTDITTLGIPGSDTVYTHPTSAAGAKPSGLYKITTDATGHVTAAEKVTKEDITTLGIPESDTVYTHPKSAAGAKPSGLYKITTDATGHVTAATAVAKEDITTLGIPASDTTYNDATQAVHGLMSIADKKKLDKIPSDAIFVPSGGSEGQVLKWGADGPIWADA